MKQIGRLAIRAEGDKVTAYYALIDTMDGALWLASVNRSAADIPEVWAAFKDMARAIVGQILFEKTGVRPTWGGEEAAPEHERSGSA